MPASSFLRSRLVFTTAGLMLIAALIFAPMIFRSEAQKRIVTAKTTQSAVLPNYDIRSDKGARSTLDTLRARNGKTADDVLALHDSFIQGEKVLASRSPSLKVEYNALGSPEVIAPDPKSGKATLSLAAPQKRSDILLEFLKDNDGLTGLAAANVDTQLKVTADYTNPDGDLSFAEVEQNINGIPVFQGMAKAGFTKTGEMIRVINDLAPGVDGSSLSTEFGDPTSAVNAAAGFMAIDPASLNLSANAPDSTDIKTVFGTGDWATTAEKFYFPTEPGVAVPAWRVLIWGKARSYYVVVDASSGALLWRKCLTQDQTQSATYNVWASSASMIKAPHNPFPISPYPLSPNGVQGTFLNRTQVTVIGNESPYTFNNNGWITDGNNTTDGNNVQAGLDRKSPNTQGSTMYNDIDPDGIATGTNRVFDFTIDPGNPSGGGSSPLPTGQSPGTCLAQSDTSLPNDYQKASITQLFYFVNRYHDELYLLGFNEQSHNFQDQNFGRGGTAGDRVSAQDMDCSGTNNANFTTPADGTRGTMQMYIFTAPNPDYDGSLDADIVLHEATHGLSNRLHGNASGLNTNMSAGMGEGWSDFYALSLTSTASDPVNGITPASAYATFGLSGVGSNNNYYGIRRFPYAPLSAVGANGKPHNPLTFADIDSSKINLSDGAFSPAFSARADEVHDMGEVWCSALWEIRARLVQRLGWDTGNRRAMQIITNGMKLAPTSPTFLSERNAIVAASQAQTNQADALADTADVWAGFAARGMGASATIQNIGTGNSDTRVTEAFDLPNLTISSTGFGFTDERGNNNGYPEPGETLTVSIELSNLTGTPATNVTAQLVGGGSANFGTISISPVARTVDFTVPAGTACGSPLNLTINVNSSLGPKTIVETIIIGIPVTTFTENFDGVSLPNLPSGWASTSVSGGYAFTTSAQTAYSRPNSAFISDPASGAGEGDLTSPSIPISASAALVSFKNLFLTESGWDGGILEVSIDDGPFTEILAAGGAFINGGYIGTMAAATSTSTYTANPLQGRDGWTGNSRDFLNTIVRLPTAAAGHNVRLRWRFGADDNTAASSVTIPPGWYIDDLQVSGIFQCTYVAASPHKARSDFDGDGKTDPSVFRGSNSNWYALQSGGGILAMQWGFNTDVLTPGDYDGDGKTDVAVYRPSNGYWYIVRSSDQTIDAEIWGVSTDKPVAGDYDGDGKADIAVYRPDGGYWIIVKSSNGEVVAPQWGLPTDIPVPGDYDGDGKADIAVYRPDGGYWIIMNSSNGEVVVRQWGLPTDVPVPGDYDGDGKTDVAIYRPDGGYWATIYSSNSQIVVPQWGLPTDIPVPGDYDGDGREDIAVFRPENGVWYIVNSHDGSIGVPQWGLPTDIPIPPKVTK